MVALILRNAEERSKRLNTLKILLFGLGRCAIQAGLLLIAVGLSAIVDGRFLRLFFVLIFWRLVAHGISF